MAALTVSKGTRVSHQMSLYGAGNFDDLKSSFKTNKKNNDIDKSSQTQFIMLNIDVITFLTLERH